MKWQSMRRLFFFLFRWSLDSISIGIFVRIILDAVFFRTVFTQLSDLHWTMIKSYAWSQQMAWTFLIYMDLFI